MSPMIVFLVSVNKYGSGKAVSGMLARGFLRRNSAMMSARPVLGADFRYR